MSAGRKVRLVATARQKIGGRSLKIGDEFEVAAAEAEELISNNKAQRSSTPRNRYLMRQGRGKTTRG